MICICSKQQVVGYKKKTKLLDGRRCSMKVGISRKRRVSGDNNSGRVFIPGTPKNNNYGRRQRRSESNVGTQAKDRREGLKIFSKKYRRSCILSELRGCYRSVSDQAFNRSDSSHKPCRRMLTITITINSNGVPLQWWSPVRLFLLV